jgi:transcription factor E
MQINFLKKVVQNNVGEEAVKIVDLLYEKKDVNEFLIAKKLELTINRTRNLLYRLSNLGIISSIRKKDKRKGWYIYFWTFNIMKSLEILEQTILNELNELNNQLQNKKIKRFYRCKICGREVNEENALLTDFTCSECGEVYDLADNSKIIEEINRQMEKLRKELNSLRIEIRQEQEKKDKRIVRINKKVDKEKKILRDKNRKINKLKREKERKIKKPSRKKDKKIGKKSKSKKKKR